MWSGIWPKPWASFLPDDPTNTVTGKAAEPVRNYDKTDAVILILNNDRTDKPDIIRFPGTLPSEKDSAEKHKENPFTDFSFQ